MFSFMFYDFLGPDPEPDPDPQHCQGSSSSISVKQENENVQKSLATNSYSPGIIDGGGFDTAPLGI